jgi:4-hydroxy-tetrahydrodipicolinate synthase
MTISFRGTYTALVTPFAGDDAGAIDFAAYDALLEHQIAGGITGVVPVGTTGESPTLTEAEIEALFARTVATVGGRAQVVAGCGSNSTAHAIHLVKIAEKAGVDAVMVVVPYYNKPTQEGLYRHYVAVAAATGLPVVLYNIPGRSSVDLLPETLERIAATAKNVVATKEATGNVLRAQEIGRRMGAGMAILSGDDGLTLPMTAVGGSGVISVTSNVLPGAVVAATKLGLDGDFPAALAAHRKLLPVHEVMFVEANPGPAKYALSRRGIGQNTVRLPLAPISEGAAAKVDAVLSAYASQAGTV